MESMKESMIGPMTTKSGRPDEVGRPLRETHESGFQEEDGQ